MRFAILDRNRIEASPKQKANCPGCGTEVVGS